MKVTVGINLAAFAVPATTATMRKKIGKAWSTECRNNGRGNKMCKFATDDLVLEENGSIEIAVTEGGRKIVCKQKMSGRKEVMWYGECDGDARDANFIKRIDQNGKEKVFGSIRVGPDICQIGPNAVGVGQIKCTAESEFEDEEEPLVGFGGDGMDGGRDLGVAGYNPSALEQTEATHAIRGSANRRRLYDDSGANIDVLVVWTKDAECTNSNLAVGCIRTNITESNMRGLIDLAIAETNAAFNLSGVNTQLRLVHAYIDSSYTEPTTNTYATALNSLRLTTDGKLDSAHAKRTLYGADAVHLIIAKGGSCGIAYSGPTKTYMFSVSRYSCATGYYSFGHEIMHNLGAKHDRGSDTPSACNVTTSSSYGYRDPSAKFRSIMAYDCTSGKCNSTDIATTCTRVQRISNTVSLYNGEAIGNAANNNAAQINAQKGAVASFFPAMNCQSNAACNDNNPATVDTCNLATSVCVFTPTS